MGEKKEHPECRDGKGVYNQRKFYNTPGKKRGEERVGPRLKRLRAKGKAKKRENERFKVGESLPNEKTSLPRKRQKNLKGVILLSFSHHKKVKKTVGKLGKGGKNRRR